MVVHTGTEHASHGRLLLSILRGSDGRHGCDVICVMDAENACAGIKEREGTITAKRKGDGEMSRCC